MITGRILNKFINVFTGLFGIATVIVMLIIYINSASPINFLGENAITLGNWKNYLTLATVFCAGLEFTLKRNFIFAIVFAVIIASLLVFMLYTDLAV